MGKRREERRGREVKRENWEMRLKGTNGS